MCRPVRDGMESILIFFALRGVAQPDEGHDRSDNNEKNCRTGDDSEGRGHVHILAILPAERYWEAPGYSLGKSRRAEVPFGWNVTGP